MVWFDGVMSDGPTLWLHTGSTSQGFHLVAGSQILGRGEDVDLRLDANEVSGRHAELRWERGSLTVIDLGSTNGTTVNGKSISAPTALADGDIVGFGPRRLVVEIGAPASGTGRPAPPPPVPPERPTPGRREPSGALGRVFISYSQRDRHLATRLYRSLERAGWRPWMADEDIAGGTAWADQIADGLRQTDVVAVLVTGESVHSEWVEREVSQAATARIPLVPVCVEGAQPRDGLRLYLDTVQRIDVTDDATDFWEVEQALLRRLDRGRRRTRATLQLRIGQALLAVGSIGLVVAFAMFMFFGYQAISSDSPSIRGLSVEEAQQQFEQQRDEGDEQFLRIASAFPVFFVSMIVAGTGESLRRAALRRRM